MVLALMVLALIVLALMVHAFSWCILACDARMPVFHLPS